MKTHKTVMMMLVMLLAAACGETDSTTEPTGDGDEGTTETRQATLFGALPADGEVVRGGELHLIAVVESEVDATAKFLVDGAPLAELNQAPYRFTIDACELSVGNHAYVVEITDENGNRDYVEQWFTVEGCD